MPRTLIFVTRRALIILGVLIAFTALGMAESDLADVKNPVPALEKERPFPKLKPVPQKAKPIKKTPGVNITGSVADGEGWVTQTSPKREFQRNSGFPNGRDGYVVDYILPLKDGGAEDAENMKWVTLDEARARAGVN